MYSRSEFFSNVLYGIYGNYVNSGTFVSLFTQYSEDNVEGQGKT